MSSPPMDPYKVLGIAMDAQLPDIRTAHRKLILKCHPDKVSDPALKAQKQDEFQKVQQAYEVLSDEEQRARCDDMLKLYALRERMSQKPNTSAPRSSPSTTYAQFEVRTAEPPRSKSYRGERETTPRDAPPNVKIFSYSRSTRDDDHRGPRYYEDVRPARRGESYSEKPSKRESERESQRDREKREDKERRREKDRRKLEKEKEREDEVRRQAEKAAKKEAKRVREKQEAKEKKREKDDKRRERETPVYIEPSDDEILHKKSSRAKYDAARERSSGRDEPPLRRTHTDGPPMTSSKMNSARAYIHRSQTSGPPNRSTTYHSQDTQPPAAPTPPPAQSAAFVAPDEDDARRSAARPRRGSSDVPPSMPRERNMHRSSREPVEQDPYVVDASPAAGRARYKAAPGESPPRGPVRANTMQEKPSRFTPPRRSYTEGPEIASSRGRGRSKMYAQAELSEDEDDFEELPRRAERSRKERSPRGQKIRYHVADGRTKLHSSSSYSRPIPQRQPSYQHEDYDYEPARSAHASRPEYGRSPSYSATYAKFKQAPAYDHRDVAYSHFEAPSHAEYDQRVYAA